MIHLLTLFCLHLSILSILSLSLNGTFSVVDDIEFVYQFPPVEKSAIKGIVFIIPGCKDAAGAFWPPSATCSKCNGQPFGQILALEGLKSNYTVFSATAPLTDPHLCWRPEDGPRMAKVIHHFYNHIFHDPAYKIPLHLLGICISGHAMGTILQNHTAMALFHPVRIASLALTIATIKLNENYTMEHKFPIPTLFLPMKKDGGIYWAIRKSMHLFQYGQLIIADEIPITPTYFYEKSLGVFNETESQVLYKLLKANDWLDEKDFLRHDPISHHWTWRQLIRKFAPEIYEKDVSNYDYSAIGQMLRGAFAHHGLAAQAFPEIYKFYDNITLTLSR